MTNEQNTGGLLAGKIALVSGAGKGIGAAAAKLFAREGATVVLAARTESDLKTVVEEITADGGQASYVVADFGDVPSIQRAVDTVVERHGRLDVAFNNAGVAVPPSRIVDVAEADFDRVNQVNYKGVFFAVAAEVRAILATAGTGAIVNNSSTGSLHANPGLPAYGSAKRAVNSLTETAAVEYGPDGIRVNAIAPGLTMTPMVLAWQEAVPDIVAQGNARTPLRRPAQPVEIAEAAAWLLSDRASYVTGVVLPVTGGEGV